MLTADPMHPRPYGIRHMRVETDDTFTMELAPVNGSGPLSFAPGQFNMVYVPGAGEIPLSISSDPATPERVLHTTRAVGYATRAMRRMHAGDIVGVRGPFGVPWPIEAAADCGKDIVIVAGGIGLAPLRPAIYRLLAQRERYGRIVVLYGTRTPEDLLYRRELELWKARLDLEVFVTVDRAGDRWRGNVGVVTTLIPKAAFNRAQTLALVCGPELMMRFTAMTLEERGVPAGSIYLSLERSMKCGIGLCGHCQFGSTFVCKDGPVYPYGRIKPLLTAREV
ncbi:MAG TPA: FAD/NAD(P)-binding protein [Vicinamibacterales bacterium]|nr:FAD/NAD(P)-binding protein [Vicinamibacterales bacterium]